MRPRMGGGGRVSSSTLGIEKRDEMVRTIVSGATTGRYRMRVLIVVAGEEMGGSVSIVVGPSQGRASGLFPIAGEGRLRG
jgi:hypothetical protein